MSRGTVAEINLSALAHNFSIAQNKIGPLALPQEKTSKDKTPQGKASGLKSKILAVVKSNAYGHGAEHVVQALPEADGFGVAFIEEALPLREITSKPLLLLEGVFSAEELALAAEKTLDVVIHSLWQAQFLEQAGLKGSVNLWLKVNTGMNRLGIMPEDLPALYRRLRANKKVGRLRLMSHFACADDPASEFNQTQLNRFKALQQQLPAPIEASMANSAGLLTQPQALLEWVRPGIMLYGGSPLLDRSAAELNLRPVMTFRSRLIAIQHLKRGESVGYGQQWRASRAMKVGIVAVGYGDGYPRTLPCGTPVLVSGVRAGLVGRVSMDMITVDLSTVPEAAVGSPVTLWGEGLPADEIAAAAQTISYELFCQVTPRVERVLRTE